VFANQRARAVLDNPLSPKPPVGAFHYAAPVLVPERLPSRATGILQITWSLSGIISPAIG
jgi:hypothetical protein